MNIKTDTATYPENPKVLQLPPAGGRYVDDLASAEVLRFTDERDGQGGSFSGTYSVWNAFNRDATRVWLFEQGGSYHVGNLNPVTLERIGPLEEVAPARGAFVDYETFFWSFLDADKGFILVDCQIWSYKPSTKQYTVVADLRSQFPAGARFNQLYVSKDDNRFAAVVRAGSSGSGDYGIMVYDLALDSIRLDIRINQINGITMDKTGKYVLLVRTDEAGGQNRQQIYNVDTGGLETLLSDANGAPDYCIGHNDCGMDFIVGGDHWRGAFTARKMSEPHNVSMVWQYATALGVGWINWHNSERADNDAWTLVSTYAGSLLGGVERFEGPFIREIFQLGVKPPFLGQFRRLVHTRASYASPHYWYTPRATISRDGRLVCWTGNNNGAPGSSRTDLFIARIDPAPTADGEIPTLPPPPPAPDPPPPPSPTDPPPTDPPAPPVDTAPVVTLIAPVNGATLSGKVIVTPTVTNTDVDSLFLLVDDVVTASTSTAPYSFSLDTTKMQDGGHSLWVRVWSKTGRPGDSARVSFTVKNVVEPPPVEPPPVEPPPPVTPCSISAPESVVIPRNSSGVIEIELLNIIGPTEVRVLVPDGQMTVSPLTWGATPTDKKKRFTVRVKKQSRTITFQSGCGVAVVKVNVT